MKKSIMILVAVICCFPVLAQEGGVDAVKQAEQQLTVRGPSAEGYYNLGLANQRAGQPVKALLNYQRALVLDPGLKPAQNALSTLAAEQRVTLPPRTWQNDVTAFVHPETLAGLGAILGWAGAFALVFGVFGTARKGVLVAVGSVGVVVGSAFFSVGWIADPRLADASLAMITANDGAELRTAPANSASPIVSLPAGSPVGVLSPRGPWTYVTLAGGAKGWVPSGSLQPVVPGETL